MATAYTARSYNEPYLVGTAAPGMITRLLNIDLVDLTGNATYTFIINDTIDAAKLPPYAKIVDGYLGSAQDLDTNVTPTLELNLLITDGTTTKTLVDQGVWSGAAQITRAGGAPATETAIGFVTTNADFKAQIKAIAGGASAAAATAFVLAAVSYVMNLEPGEYPGN